MTSKEQEHVMGINNACEVSSVTATADWLPTPEKSRFLSPSFSNAKARCAAASTTTTEVTNNTTKPGSKRWTSLHSSMFVQLLSAIFTVTAWWEDYAESILRCPSLLQVIHRAECNSRSYWSLDAVRHHQQVMLMSSSWNLQAYGKSRLAKVWPHHILHLQYAPGKGGYESSKSRQMRKRCVTLQLHTRKQTTALQMLRENMTKPYTR